MRPGQHKRLPNHIVGLIALVVITIAFLLAFTKKLPWSEGYEVQAVFTTAQNIRTDSPVRVAGVEVGKVTRSSRSRPATRSSPGTEERDRLVGDDRRRPRVGPAGGARDDGDRRRRAPDQDRRHRAASPAPVPRGQPLRRPAPGSPGAPEAPDGYVLPIDQTSVSVQLDQVLTTLQSDVRTDLQVFLEEFGAALVDHGGAEGFQEIYETSPAAFKYTSQVNEAFLGTEPHDLSGVIRNFDKIARALVQNEEQLKDLVTNFRIFAGSFAAEERRARAGDRRAAAGASTSGNAAFANLNDSFPPLRAFAVEALPGVRSTPETLDVATPFVRQVRLLVSKQELRGLVAELRPTIPRLAKLSKKTIPFLAAEPPARELLQRGDHPVVARHRRGRRGLSVPGGRPRLQGDRLRADGHRGREPLRRRQRAVHPRPGRGRPEHRAARTRPRPRDPQVGVLQQQLLGQMPRIEASAKTPFRPNQPCELQEPPDLNAGPPGAPPARQSAAPAPDAVEPAEVPDDLNQDEIEQELLELMSDIDASDEGEDTASTDEDPATDSEDQG